MELVEFPEESLLGAVEVATRSPGAARANLFASERVGHVAPGGHQWGGFLNNNLRGRVMK